MLFLIANLPTFTFQDESYYSMMNTQEILKKIGNIIQELGEQHEYLSNANEINPLELELFSASADFLIDHIAILNKLNQVSAGVPLLEEDTQAQDFSFSEEASVEVSPASEESYDIIHEPVFEESNAVKESSNLIFDMEEPQELEFDFEKNVNVEQIFDRQLSNEEQEVIDKLKQPEEVEAPKLQENIIAEQVFAVSEENYVEADKTIAPQAEAENAEPFLFVKKEQQPVIELPVEKEEPVSAAYVSPVPVEPVKQEAAETKPMAESEKKLSLNEMLSANRNHASSTFDRPITDLKAVISLNDKMIFIKELFNGYNLAYSEAIEILNRFDSFEAADNFLIKNYAEKNNWAEKQAVVDRLYEILNRKFKK